MVKHQSQTTQLRKVQKRAARLIMKQSYETPSAELFTNLKWMTLEERFEFNRVMMIYKCLHNCAPSYLQSDLINPGLNNLIFLIKNGYNFLIFVKYRVHSTK